MVAELVAQGVLAQSKLLPHQPYVHLDRDRFKRRWLLSHGLTGESVELVEPYDDDLELVFDDDGFGCLVSDDACVLVRELFSSEIWQGTNGEHILQRFSGEGGDLEPTIGALETLQNMWEVGSMHTCIGQNRTAIVLDIVQFTHMKHGAHFWFSAANLFAKGLASFIKVGFPSTWVHKALPAWLVTLGRLQASQHLLKSKPYGEVSEEHAGRSLPFVSLSTIGAVGIVSAWGCASTRFCGLGAETSREAARSLLLSILEPLRGWLFSLELLLADCVEERWPRPCGGDGATIVAKVDGNMNVDMTKFESLAAEGLGAERDLAGCVMHLVGGKKIVSLVELVRLLWTQVRTAWGLAMLTQLVHEVGKRIDERLVHLACGAPLEGSQCSTKVEILPLDLASDYKLDHALRRYIGASEAAMAGGLFHSICADKSRVGTVGLQVGAIVNSSNVAAWLVPQAFGGPPGGLIRDWGAAGPDFPRHGIRGLQSGISISFWARVFECFEGFALIRDWRGGG